MGAFEFVIFGLLLVNLGYSVYASRKAPAILAAPFVRALGEKEGELIVLRATLQQVAGQIRAQQELAAKKDPEKVATRK